MVAAITSDALLKFFVRQMLNELREHALAEVHASLSCLSENDSKMVISLNQLQIVPGFNCCKPFGANQLQSAARFFPDSSGFP